MPTDPNQPRSSWDPQSHANRFMRVGSLGFWMQLALLVVPLVLLIYVIFVNNPDSVNSKGIDLSNYLSHGSLLVMLFTTFWFFRYHRLGKRMADPGSTTSEASVLRALWIGLWAGCIGIVFSVVLLASAVGRLLFVLIATPQTGIPVVTALGGDAATTLSAIDAVSLMSLVIGLAAELIVLSLSLWLLFAVTRRSPEANTAQQ